MSSKADIVGTLDCMMGHAAAVGDANGDGHPDLFVGTFADRPPDRYGCRHGAGPDRLLINQGDGTFTRASEPAIEQHARTSGAVFADLDGDGDLDLVATRNARSVSDPVKARPTALYRNDGGTFVDVTDQSGLAIPGMKARNVVPLDYDGDRQLDLLIVDDLLGSVGTKLFHNEGGLRFRDRTHEAGLPTELGGLGAAAGDVDADGWPDIFIAHEDKLFLNDGSGQFRYASNLEKVFTWPGEAGSEDWRAGAAFGDVDRDGDLDLVVGHHYGSASEDPRPVRLYLNRSEDGTVAFEDVTNRSGLTALPAKAPHVEIQDLDNDGWPDLFVSEHALQEGALGPLVFRNLGEAGRPAFTTSPFTVPGDGETRLGYWAAAPTLDFDRDGRLDIFGIEWFPKGHSVLYRNVSAAGNYLEVALHRLSATNSMGIGARIEIYERGRLGEPSALLGYREIGVGYGYSSGQEAVAHFGLATETAIDLRVILPHGGPVLERTNVRANQRVILAEQS